MKLIFLVYACLAILGARALVSIFQSLTSPLRSVPGPYFARLTRLWYFIRVRNGEFEKDNIALHRKYGPIVRVAPNMYSIDAPDVVKQVYNIGSTFAKSDWYDAWRVPDPTKSSLFADRDIKRHGDNRRRFQAMYSMSSTVNYEPYVDECLTLFTERFTQFSEQGKTIDLAQWVQFFAFDVIACVTYSRRFGFLETQEDVGGLIALLEDLLQYASLMGIFAEWHAPLFDLLARFKSSGAGARAQLNKHIQKWMDEKRAERSDGDKLTKKNENAPQDFTEKLLTAHDEEPEKVSQYHVFMGGLANITAGSDTTAATLSAIFYYLYNNPEKLKNLRREIDQFESDGLCSRPHVGFKEAQNMPYLQACMRESMRLHAATGLPLWRVVPTGGAEICSQWFPAGTVVGINTWVAHYNEEVFGSDASEFRPERWIEAEGTEQWKVMDAYYFPFGLGSRTCIGRHIATLEISKLVPGVVRLFDVEQITPGLEWETKNFWFVKPKNFKVKVRNRNNVP